MEGYQHKFPMYEFKDGIIKLNDDPILLNLLYEQMKIFSQIINLFSYEEDNYRVSINKEVAVIVPNPGNAGLHFIESRIKSKYLIEDNKFKWLVNNYNHFKRYLTYQLNKEGMYTKKVKAPYAINLWNNRIAFLFPNEIRLIENYFLFRGEDYPLELEVLRNELECAGKFSWITFDAFKNVHKPNFKFNEKNLIGYKEIDKTNELIEKVANPWGVWVALEGEAGIAKLMFNFFNAFSK